MPEMDTFNPEMRIAFEDDTDGRDLVWRNVAKFEAGRMRLAQDHNGNVELTIRIPPEHRKLAYGVTDYAGIRLLVTIAVPEQALVDDE